MSSTAFALILPAMMAVVACAFLLLSRSNLPAAFAWGLGFGFSAAAFTTSATLASPHAAALVSDFFFIAAFYFYAEGFLIHFSRPRHRRERLAFVAIYLIMNVHVVLRLESLHLELLLNDIATSCLLGFALRRVMNHARSVADRAAVLAGSVVVIDTLIRVLLFVWLAGSSDRLENYGQSSYAHTMQITTAIVGLIYALSIAGALADRVIGRLQDAAKRDPLTQLLNRHGFDRAMESTGRDGKLAGAVLICDIDHFKPVNDQFGYATGDRVIRVFADTVTACLPRTAISARFDGEEFVVFLPHSSLAAAGILAQTLRAHFAARDWRHIGVDRQITASFGVASIFDGEDTARAALKRADRALYDAKAAGRNKVVWDGGNYEPDGTVVDIQRTIRNEARRVAEGR